MKVMLNIFAMLYLVSPLIIVPAFAYIESNPYLLFGVLFSYAAGCLVIIERFKSFIPLFLLLCIGVWARTGFSFYQYVTFFFFCSLSGHLFAAIADRHYLSVRN